jgi:hypothetical protein
VTDDEVLMLRKREGGEIQIGTYVAHRHSYVTEIIDQQATHDQAVSRAKDGRHPESTVIHFHKAHEPCNGHQHEKYPVKHDG